MYVSYVYTKLESDVSIYFSLLTQSRILVRFVIIYFIIHWLLNNSFLKTWSKSYWISICHQFAEFSWKLANPNSLINQLLAVYSFSMFVGWKLLTASLESTWRHNLLLRVLPKAASRLWAARLQNNQWPIQVRCN